MVFRNSVTARWEVLVFKSMLPLVSKRIPTESGASSPEKWVIFCSTPSSKMLKSCFSSPSTKRFMGSVTVTGITSRVVSTTIFWAERRASGTRTRASLMRDNISLSNIIREGGYAMEANMKANKITRRDFAATTAGALAIVSDLAAQTVPAKSPIPLDLAEWSYFWIGVERAELARGTVVNGKQMYVEYMVPARPIDQAGHPYPIVMVHGGGGQGTDWMGTPDGRAGWATYFLQEGYSVYIVDRPGHGRSPFNPDIDGPFPRGAQAYEQVEHQFTAPEKAEKPYAECAKLHTQWPGTGTIGDPAVDQIVAGQGGSFLADLEATHNVWRNNMSLLLGKIGPASTMRHSIGGPNRER